ncbi:hypothetical protein ACGF7U_12150 [Micromonospora sp. NPDC047670]|uniref:hypothetical protein n=1 Tax=Micromonospora sp. NPDC047670 TaxID=3364252 RepID=UPI0037160E8B
MEIEEVAMPGGAEGLSLIVRVGIVLGLVFALAACGAEGDTAPVKQPGPPTCPATFVKQTPVKASRDGDFVPGGGSTALLCVYSFPRSGPEYPLRQAIPLTVDKVGELVDYLNTLDSADLENNACLFIGRDQYQVILGYPDNTNVTVRVDYNCGTVSAAGAVRRLGGGRKLLGFWPEGAATVRRPADPPSAHK